MKDTHPFQGMGEEMAGHICKQRGSQHDARMKSLMKLQDDERQ